MEFAWQGFALFAGALLVWSLALYVFTRGSGRNVPAPAALAMTGLAVYLLGAAASMMAPSWEIAAAWERWAWWGASLSPAFWLWTALALSLGEARDAVTPLARRAVMAGTVAAVIGGGILAVAGTTTDLLYVWPATALPDVGAGGPGPYYAVFLGYTVVCVASAVASLGTLWYRSPPGTPLRARFGTLLLAALGMLGGAAWITLAVVNGTWAFPGQAVLLISLLDIGWSVARYGALLAGEVVPGDLAGYGIAVTLVVAVYGGLLLALNAAGVLLHGGWLIVLPVAVLTHVLVDRRTHLPGARWLDETLYGPVQGRLRADLRTLAARIIRLPDPIEALVEVREATSAMVHTHAGNPASSGNQTGSLLSEPDARIMETATPPEIREASDIAPTASEPPPAFRLLVEGALRHLNDLPALSQHALVPELILAREPDGTALERAARLRETLITAIGRLSPATPKPAIGTAAGGWVHAIVLHEAYV